MKVLVHVAVFFVILTLFYVLTAFISFEPLWPIYALSEQIGALTRAWILVVVIASLVLSTVGGDGK